jgi:uncharacterized membrane protein YedE/YeeE
MLYVTSLVSGVLFGAGLALSQMINPAKVLNFLDVSGRWDPTLLLVFAGALVVAMPAYQLCLRTRKSPFASDRFRLPAPATITPSLIAGAVIFGIGWGLSGFCPGPSIAALATLLPAVIVYVVAMFLGAACYKWLASRRARDV